MQQQSWNNVANWYDSIVGEKGQYFHTHVIFPRLLPLMGLVERQTVLDIGCGQGVFCRELSKKGVRVMGIDASPRLIEEAKKYSKNISYAVDDARTLNTIANASIDAATSILAMQNIDPIDGVFTNVARVLKKGGSFTIVILHPAFRSPRITGWGEDTARKLQFRRVDRYLSPMKIPIDMHPGRGQKQLTWTYHRPLQRYVELGAAAGFLVSVIEEWVSDKQSEGRHAKTENLARSEIPLFMAIKYSKY